MTDLSQALKIKFTEDRFTLTLSQYMQSITGYLGSDYSSLMRTLKDHEKETDNSKTKAILTRLMNMHKANTIINAIKSSGCALIANEMTRLVGRPSQSVASSSASTHTSLIMPTYGPVQSFEDALPPYSQEAIILPPPVYNTDSSLYTMTEKSPVGIMQNCLSTMLMVQMGS